MMSQRSAHATGLAYRVYQPVLSHKSDLSADLIQLAAVLVASDALQDFGTVLDDIAQHLHNQQKARFRADKMPTLHIF